jgi:hypothetical protein
MGSWGLGKRLGKRASHAIASLCAQLTKHWITALVATLCIGALRRRTLLLATVALTWSGYLAVIGGDFFWQHRHIVPLVPVLA